MKPMVMGVKNIYDCHVFKDYINLDREDGEIFRHVKVCTTAQLAAI